MAKGKQRAGGERASVRERISRALEIPSDVFTGEVSVHVRGRNHVEISGSGVIREYTDEKISLRIRGGEICIRGRRLLCTAYRRGEVTITGQVRSVSFEEE